MVIPWSEYIREFSHDVSDAIRDEIFLLDINISSAELYFNFDIYCIKRSLGFILYTHFELKC